MIIRNGLVFGEDYNFTEQTIVIEDTTIKQVTQLPVFDNAREPIIDAGGCYVIPGLTDIHIHGCRNKDFCDAALESIGEIAEYEASVGVTSICPTTMTVPYEKLMQVAEVTKKYCESLKTQPKKHEKESFFAGINMEGPFIAPAKKGSQELSDIQKPDVAFIESMQEKSGGAIKLVDVAPEIDGAMQVIEQISNQIIVSIAHTAADYDTAQEAMRRGAHHVTHLYNAMSPYEHRAPGVVGAASDDPLCMVELICDGFHNHPSIVRNTLRMFGSDRVVFVSDGMRATGMPDGIYELGGHAVKVTGNKALLEDGTIAASVTNLLDCMKTSVQKMGIPLTTAVKCAAVNPAKSIGMYEKFGSLSSGKLANVLLLDQKTLELKKVILRGKEI